MPRRPLKNNRTRNIQQSGNGSYFVTLPIEIVQALGWKKRQKVVVEKRGQGISIIDWK